MDKNALLYYKSACALKFPATIRKQIHGFEIKLGKTPYYFRGGDTPFNCGSSIGVASNKYCMNKILEASGYPVPKACAFRRDEFEQINMDSLSKQLKFPLVVKPMQGTAMGKDVLCNITNIEQLSIYMKKSYRKHQFLTLEEFYSGLNSYRVLIFYNQVIGVVQRFSARVTGDGVHSISELIALANIVRDSYKKTVSLGPLKVDEEYLIRLKEVGMTVDTIPAKNETVVLCYTCNSTRGGTMKSLGNKICKENARLLCRAAKTLNLNIVGFDIQCEDILIPIEKSRGVIIEANHNPDISIHESPMSGIQNRVSLKILFRLIWRHPLAYLLGRCQTRRNFHLKPFYAKSLLIAFIVITWKYC